LIVCGCDKQKITLKHDGGGAMAGLEGQKAPAFTLEGSDGKQHSLSDYAGKNVILWFYPKDDTPG
jgi:peroxiredoxin